MKFETPPPSLKYSDVVYGWPLTCSCDKYVRKVIIEKNPWFLLENSFTMRPLIFDEIRRSSLKNISWRVLAHEQAYQNGLMLRPSTGPKLFWACPNFLVLTKNWYTFCASPKHFVPHQKITYILPFSKFGFCAGTKLFEEALNIIKFLDWLKQFGLAQKCWDL